MCCQQSLLGLDLKLFLGLPASLSSPAASPDFGLFLSSDWALTWLSSESMAHTQSTHKSIPLAIPALAPRALASTQNPGSQTLACAQQAPRPPTEWVCALIIKLRDERPPPPCFLWAVRSLSGGDHGDHKLGSQLVSRQRVKKWPYSRSGSTEGSSAGLNPMDTPARVWHPCLRAAHKFRPSPLHRTSYSKEEQISAHPPRRQ